MTNEEKFHKEVLESFDHWVNELTSKTKEDFDSIEDYGNWIEKCVIAITREINNSRYEYLENGLDETISDLRRKNGLSMQDLQ